MATLMALQSPAAGNASQAPEDTAKSSGMIVNPQAQMVPGSTPSTGAVKNRLEQAGVSHGKSKALIIGDSIVKKTKVFGKGVECKTLSFSGANIDKIKSVVVDLKDAEAFDVVVVHCGSNNIVRNKSGRITNSGDILNKFQQLMVELKKRFSKAKIVMSGIFFRSDTNDYDINYVNEFLGRECEDQANFLFVDPNSWVNPGGLGRDGVHLNNTGNNRFASLLRRIIFSALAKKFKSKSKVKPKNLP